MEWQYPSDLTDAEWEIIEAMLPSPQWMGRPEKNFAGVVDAIPYVVRTGRTWRYLPVDFAAVLGHRHPRALGHRLGPDRLVARPRRRKGLATYPATTIRHAFADSGFAGRLVDWARDPLAPPMKIVRKPADQQGFVVHPRRWSSHGPWPGLPTTAPWPARLRSPPKTSEAMIRCDALGGMLRRLTPRRTRHRPPATSHQPPATSHRTQT
ncbi:transposase [Micromonospora sp. DT41]|uniref:transposase n=1 Tax=Micromonospora sp. DT41 TaxID=3393437 RepID=UPI003CEA4D22